MKTLKNKTFYLGQIAYCSGNNRKIRPVMLRAELSQNNKGQTVFTASATVYRSDNYTDCILAGQCLDELKNYFKNNDIFKSIYKYWKLYHLNDMHAGTPKQEAALEYYKTHEGRGGCFSYTEQCEYLESIGLLYDNGYKYGSSWLYQAIPAEDLEQINILLN